VSDTSDFEEEQAEGSGRKQGAGMLRYALHCAWRYRILIVFSAAVGMSVGVFRGLKIPDQYGSMGKLFVRPGIRETLTPESAFSADGGIARMSSRESVLNEMQILASPQLYERAVDIVGVDTLLAPFEPDPNNDASDSWVRSLLRRLQRWSLSTAESEEIPVDDAMKKRAASLLMSRAANIFPEIGASVISFHYTADTPSKAQAAVNALLAAAIDLHSEVFKSMSSVGTIEEEQKNAEKLARAAEVALRTFRADKHIYDFDQQREALLAYLGQVEHLRDDGAIAVARKQAEVELLESQEKTVKKVRDVQGSTSFVLNPRYTALQTLLTQAQLRTLELESQRSTLQTEDYERRKKTLETFVAGVQQELSNEDLQLKLQGSTEENPDYVEIVQALQQRRVELKGLAKQDEQLKTMIADTQSRLDELEAIQPELQRMSLDAKQKRETADRIASAVTSMRAVQRLEQLNLSNLGIMHPATFEPARIGPKRTQRVLVAGALGGMIGLGLALLMCLRDKYVRSHHDLAWIGADGDEVLVESSSKRRDTSKWDPGELPAAVASMRREIVQAWSGLPYDRRSKDALRLAFVPCGDSADASRSAGLLAIGLAALGGEQVACVSCTDDDGWLARSLQLTAVAGWSEVLEGGLPLERALMKTEIGGLSYLPVGAATNHLPHPMAAPGFVAMLDQLCATHRFVIVELPDIDVRPESRAVLKVIDGAQLVVRVGEARRDAVRGAIEALEGAGTRMIGTVLQVGRA